MGLQAVPAYIASAGFQHPATLDRNLVEAIFGGRQGASRSGEFIASVGVGTRAIQVSPGRYHVLGTENAQQGGYFAWSDTADTFLLGAAVGNPRVDTILLRIHDDQYGSIPGSPGAYFDVVQGVAAGSPTARADSDFNTGGSFYVPGAWARIADVRVNVADTGSIPAGQITNVARYARMAGWTLCTSTTRPADPLVGDRIHETDTTLRRYWTGSAWMQDKGYFRHTILASNAANMEITGIPTVFRTLRLVYSARSTVVGNFEQVNVRVNNNSGTNYNSNYKSQSGTTVSGSVASGGTFWGVGFVPGANIASNFFGSGTIDILNWSGEAGSYPQAVWQTGMSNVSQHFNHNGHGVFHTTGPYTSIRILPDSGSNWLAGSWMRIEGWD